MCVRHRGRPRQVAVGGGGGAPVCTVRKADGHQHASLEDVGLMLGLVDPALGQSFRFGMRVDGEHGRLLVLRAGT